MFIKFIHCINYWFVALYYPKSINACKTPTLCICLKKQIEKINVMVLTKGFTGDFGDAIMNLV